MKVQIHLIKKVYQSFKDSFFNFQAKSSPRFLKSSSGGMTLIELIVASLITSVVILVIWSGFLSLTNMSAVAEAKARRSFELNQALDFIGNDIREARAINTFNNIAADGVSYSVADVVQASGIPLGNLGNYGEISLYLEIPTDTSVQTCPAPGGGTVTADSVDRVVYDIRDSSAEWLPPKVVARYGRIRQEGLINPCSQPFGSDVIADTIADQVPPRSCDGVRSGLDGFQVCQVGTQVDFQLKSSIDDIGMKDRYRTISPRVKLIQTPEASLRMWASPPPNEGFNLFWEWSVDGQVLTKEEDLAEGYYVRDIDWVVKDPNTPAQNHYATTIVNRFAIDMPAYSEFNLVGFNHRLPEVTDPYLMTCFTAHGVMPSGDEIQSNEVCSTHDP